MYSGTTLTRYSGRVLGAHQKVDRVARKHLSEFGDAGKHFPSSRQILHFEGKNGPDGIKRKSPASVDVQHWYDPYDEDDSNLLEQVSHHYEQLVRHLLKGNSERAAFEAAWLSHAIVDGLTPAHHYPFEEKLGELCGGAGLDERTTFLKKNVMPGQSPMNMVMNNWRYWGPKGLFVTHWLFEWGLASIMAPMRFRGLAPDQHDLTRFHDIGGMEWFKHTARRIAQHDLYDRFYDSGWTPALAYEVRSVLAPAMVRTVCLFWHSALVDAELLAHPRA